MKKRILITGGSSLLGLYWAIGTRSQWEVILGIHRRGITLPGTAAWQLDWRSASALTAHLESIAPDLVVHTVGSTSIEACEADPANANFINAGLASMVADYCGKHDIGLIHISTDQLFDGTCPTVTEDHPVHPLNVYGHTKAAAEQEVLYRCPHALVVRTNFYGWGPSYRRSFSDWIIDSLGSGKTIEVFEDVFYTPTLASELVHDAMTLWSQGLNRIVHLGGPEKLSKLEFARRLAVEMSLDEALIIPSRLSANTALVKRPKDMSLSSKKAWSMLPSRPSSVAKHLQQLRYQKNDENVISLRQL